MKICLLLWSDPTHIKIHEDLLITLVRPYPHKYSERSVHYFGVIMNIDEQTNRQTNKWPQKRNLPVEVTTIPFPQFSAFKYTPVKIQVLTEVIYLGFTVSFNTVQVIS